MILHELLKTDCCMQSLEPIMCFWIPEYPFFSSRCSFIVHSWFMELWQATIMRHIGIVMQYSSLHFLV